MFIDLTQYIDEKTVVYPKTPSVKIKLISSITQDGFNEQQITLTTHTSTHIDAPFHMRSDAKPLSAYSIDHFIGDAVVINVIGQQKIQADLTAVKKDDIVFFNTGHQVNLHNPDYFSKYPVLSTQTAEELIKKQVRIVGIDSFTVDSSPYPVHHLFFQHDICIVEGLVHLDQITQHRFRCFIIPLKLRNNDGAPCRVIAEIP